MPIECFPADGLTDVTRKGLFSLASADAEVGVARRATSGIVKRNHSRIEDAPDKLARLQRAVAFFDGTRGFTSGYVLARRLRGLRKMKAQHTDAEAVVLLLVDGLAHDDVKRHAANWMTRTTPVLVDGVSNTEQGMRRIIGHPPLSQRLFDAGFRTCLGFTYWERAEEWLTDRLFMGFGDRVRKVKLFDEALAALEQEDLCGAFVQIVRMGLDGAAHRQRERPNVPGIVMEVLNDFERLMELFERKGVSAWVHLTSDHGILWAYEHALQIYEFGGAEHPRYYEHAKTGEHVLTVTFEGKEFALLNYPYLRRELRATEWGVHGGLSFEESVTPLMSVQVKV